jgi:RHS repeat-associated protein
MNGDSLVDFEYFGSDRKSVRAVNDGKGGWIIEDGKILNQSYEYGIPSMWSKPADFNGDGRMDIINSMTLRDRHTHAFSVQSSVQLADGTVRQNAIPMGFNWTEPNKPDHGASIADLNGDGLPDVVQSHRIVWGENNTEVQDDTCLNNRGNTCTLTDLWVAPRALMSDQMWTQPQRQTYVQDCNYDGLADFYYSGSGATTYINDGKGTWNGQASNCRFNTMDSLSYRYFDANGDGLIDRLVSQITILPVGQKYTNELTINTGGGNHVLRNIFPIALGTFGQSWNKDNGVRLIDLNGDGLKDIMQSLHETDSRTGMQTVTKKVYINKGSRPYYLRTVNTSSGSRISLAYENSNKYFKENGSNANQDLPINVITVKSVSVYDGVRTSNSTQYFYEDGHYYFNASDNREMAGFRIVSKKDAMGFETKTYYHQSENSVTDEEGGEFQDHISKKGMPYRTEAYDRNGNLVKATINKYEKRALAGGRQHSYLARSVVVTYNPDDGLNRTTAKVFEYDSYGNPTVVTDYGEVALSAQNGAFTDIGSDLLRQTASFVENTDDHIIGLPFEKKTFDQADQMISHSKTYYDNEVLGIATIGNPTRMESWLNSDGSFIGSDITYNEFGMLVLRTNPRGYSSSITYDANNLYPQNQVNAIGHTVTYNYDVMGWLMDSTDPNGAVTANEYDGLGRLVKTRITNPKTGGLTTSMTAVYTDSGMPRKVKQTSHNDDGKTIDTYSYIDGFGRTIEVKQKGSGGQWIVSGTIYDSRGNAQKTIQAYTSGSSDYETLDANLIGTSFTYDTLNRMLTATDALGTSTTDYKVWDKTVTDPNGKEKDFSYDARGRLIEVGEHLGGEANSTNYDYDSADRLTEITDASGNVRNFTYDSLNRRLTQTDAARPGATGNLWRYKYDENGNLVERTDPLGQVVTYSYDGLDRPTQEDFLGGGGLEYTYIYDQGLNSVGRVTSIAGQNYQHNFEYDQLGRVLRDQKQIDGRDFVFAYEYDLMGGVTKMTYPDDMDVFYDYDEVHQLSKVYSDGKVFADQFDYTPLGQLSEINLGNSVVTTNTYNPNQMYRLTRKQSLHLGAIRLQDFQYEYDAMGNLTQLTDESSAETSKIVDYMYDDLYRLTEARYTNTGNSEFITMNYQYDKIGNMIFKSDVGLMSYSGSNPHAVTSTGEHTYIYDANGNMVGRDDSTMAYDYKNRMTQSSDGTTYAYDEGGKRIRKRIRKNDKFYPNKYYEIDGGKETKFVYAGAQKIAKVVRFLIEPPTVEEVTADEIIDPSYTFRGTKEAGLSMWVNGIELLPAGPETEWEYATELQIGENRFDFYTKEGEEAVSKTITRVIEYNIPMPTVELIESPVTATRLQLNGTKRVSTSLWLNGEEVLTLGDETEWAVEVELKAEQNTLELVVKDRLGQESEPIQLNITYFPTPPTVDEFVQPVTQNPITISGTKMAGMGIWVNSNEVVPANQDAVWQAKLTLTEGVNQFNITAKSEFGVESNGVILVVPYNTDAPTIEPISSPTSDAFVTLSGTKREYTSVWINGKEVIPVVDPTPATISSGSHTFSGTKPAGTGIWINGKEVVPADETTVWFVEMALTPGSNHFEISTKSKFGIASEAVSVDITYTPSAIPTSTVTVRASNGSGGGGHSDPNINTLLFRRMEEQKAQVEGIAAKEEGKISNKPLDSIDPNVISDLIIYSQSGDKTNTPKSLWPTATSKTGVEFKNLQITYRTKKVMIKWDKMSKEVATFDIYRSKESRPERLSKHASEKISSIKASQFKNRYEDKDIKNGDQYVYRIAALDHNGKILTTSIKLNPDQIFIAQSVPNKVNFKKYTNEEFNKIHISSHSKLDFKHSNDPQKMIIIPDGKFREGTKIHVRFINCAPKKNGGQFCSEVEEKILDVYAIKKPIISIRLKKLTEKVSQLLIPDSMAAGPQPEEKIYYYLSDHLGSTDVVLNEDGDTVKRTDYLPFGNERLVAVDTPTLDEDYGFTGKELDEETGLYYYGARYYDPLIGRFTQLDPLILGESSKPFASVLVNPQELNGYTYVMNNPLKYVDPNGMWGVMFGLGGRSHQYITSEAIKSSNTDLGLLSSSLLIARSSTWSDIFAYSSLEEKKSHNHSTSSGNAMTGLEIKSAMMNDAEKWYKSDTKSDFGRLLHMAQDSYAPSHVKRDENGNINAFLDFEQQKFSEHIELDNYKDENGEVRPEASQAINASSKLIDYYYNDTSWDTVENYLDAEVLKGVNESTSVGTAWGKEEEENE